MDTIGKVPQPDSEAFIQRHYETLKDMARSRRRRTQAGHGMLTTDILHEAWLKFGKRTIWND